MLVGGSRDDQCPSLDMTNDKETVPPVQFHLRIEIVVKPA